MRISLVLFFVFEWGFVTLFRSHLPALLNSWLHFLSGLAFALLFLRLVLLRGQKRWPDASAPAKNNWTWLLHLPLALLSGLMLWPIIQQEPIDLADASNSDVLPQVTFLVQRLLEGDFPYHVIIDWSRPMTPTYLPLQWLPFVLAEWLGVDYRLLPLVAYFLAGLLLHRFLTRRGMSRPVQAIFISLPYLVLWIQFFSLPTDMAVSFESLIAAYYLLLCLSFFSPSRTIRGLTLLFCLLSRYSLVLWVPLYAAVVWIREGWKSVWRISLLVFLGVVLLYLLPFLSLKPSIFMDAYAYHTEAAVLEWTTSDWQAEGAPPFQLHRGIGMAGWIEQQSDGTPEEGLQVLQRLHLWGSLGVVALLAVLFWRYRQRWHTALFLLGSFKLYLVFFYDWIQIPYPYLFLTPLLLNSLVLACAWLLLAEKK